jgi:hypothetical protein
MIEAEVKVATSRVHEEFGTSIYKSEAPSPTVTSREEEEAKKLQSIMEQEAAKHKRYSLGLDLFFVD